MRIRHTSRLLIERLKDTGRCLERNVRSRLPESLRGSMRRLFSSADRPKYRPPAAAEPHTPTATATRDRGTILIVAHDANVGGAQQVARIFGSWLLKATRYDVKFVVMQGGGLIGAYAAIAPVFNVSACPPDRVEQQLLDFVGEEPRAIVINSVASGGFLRHWTRRTPVVAFIHELSKLLQAHADSMALIRERAAVIVAGSAAVAATLRDEHGCDERRLEVVHGFIEDGAPGAEGEPADKRIAKQAIHVAPDEFLVTACGVAHWRKSPRTFVEVAARVLARTRRRVRFIWVGHGPDIAECEALARTLRIADRVSFTGYEPDIQRFLRASDLFLLPSEEDPFPLVCLYAGLAHNPVVCFADAGGTPELVAGGGGRVVPFGDATLMADAVLEYLDDTASISRDGAALRATVLERHTVATAGPSLLHWIRTAAGLRPHVTVVVPNYNYGRFLPERLASLRRQTYQDFEVVLLDDHSTDDSVPLLESWAGSRAGTRVVANTTNSGSPFSQWMKGISMAQGGLTWIAEADDSCDATLLTKLVARLDDRNVFLAYAKSTPVDADGAVLGDYDSLYLDRICPGRWKHDYVASDHEEASAGLGIANCIPNASSVVFRTFTPEPEFAAQWSGMRLCGDWLFYLRAMRGGSVSYCAEPLNLHRRHDGTVTSGTEGTPRYFAEFEAVRQFVARTYRLTTSAAATISAFDAADASRFGGRRAMQQRRQAKPSASLPAVLFVTSDLSPGGGQMFIIRLANAWARRGGRAAIFNAAKFPDHPHVVAKISPQVSVFASPHADVAEIVSRFGCDLVHSAIWWADDCVLAAAERFPWLPWVITMHGCHETLLDHPHVDRGFARKAAAMLRRADVWVHTAAKNLRLFSAHGRPAATVRIDNGVEVEHRPRGDGQGPLCRTAVGLSASALVVCLASRAIPEKGWAEAVAAVSRLRTTGRNVELLLIGEGPAADAVRHDRPAGVIQVDHVSNLQDYLSLADVVLLPSYFVGESLPLVLLEAMALGKPVVATPVGEIPTLVGPASESAGVLVPLVAGRPDVAAIAAAIDSLASGATRQAMSRAARRRFDRQYTLDAMVDCYADLYRSCIAARRPSTRSAA